MGVERKKKIYANVMYTTCRAARTGCKPCVYPRCMQACMISWWLNIKRRNRNIQYTWTASNPCCTTQSVHHVCIGIFFQVKLATSWAGARRYKPPGHTLTSAWNCKCLLYYSLKFSVQWILACPTGYIVAHPAMPLSINPFHFKPNKKKEISR